MRRVGTAVLVAALLGGCGAASDDGAAQSNAYVAAVNAAQERFHRAETAVQASVTAATSTPEQDRAALDQLRDAVDDVVGELRGITPPAAVAPLHQRLVDAVAGYLPVIRERRDATARSARALIAARTAFTTASEGVNADVQRAITRINAKLSG